MIFTPEHVRMIAEGRKTQTRRIYKLGDNWTWGGVVGERYGCMTIHTVMQNGRMKWRVGNTYAVQPGRSKPATMRIRITAIRLERLQDISEEDVLAEGCESVEGRSAYAELWNSINQRKGTRWQDNPYVFVLTFSPVTA